MLFEFLERGENAFKLMLNVFSYFARFSYRMTRHHRGERREEFKSVTKSVNEAILKLQ
jgi:hypothetical protein